MLTRQFGVVFQTYRPLWNHSAMKEGQDHIRMWDTMVCRVMMRLLSMKMITWRKCWIGLGVAHHTRKRWLIHHQMTTIIIAVPITTGKRNMKVWPSGIKNSTIPKEIHQPMNRTRKVTQLPELPYLMLRTLTVTIH